MGILLTHSGKQHSYRVAKALLDLDKLSQFCTSSYVGSKRLQKWLLKNGNQYWTRRFTNGLEGKFVESNWRFEITELILRKVSGKSAAVQNAVYQRDIRFDKYIARTLKKRPFDVLWGFQGSCYNSLKQANALGKATVCELATAHVTESKKILGEEKKLHPEWADSLDNLVFPIFYEDQLQKEPHIANWVIAASEFTRQSLLNDGVEESKINVLPLGFDANRIPFKQKQGDITKRPLRLLYAGTVTQRKGIKYLLEAMKGLNKNDVELHIIGGIQGRGDALKEYKPQFILHPPVHQDALFMLYSEYDALVLPTVFEGFGLVIVEAMAAGLPVITTNHSIGPDLIEEGKNGYIVPIRDVDNLRKAIEKLRNLTQAAYSEMQKKARISAESYSWDTYQRRLSEMLTGLGL